MTAEIIALPVVWVDRSVKDDGSGNDARPIIAGFYRGNYEQADRFLAALWLKGFKVVPLNAIATSHVFGHSLRYAGFLFP